MATSLTSTVVIVCLFLGNILVSNGYLYQRLCQPSTSLVRIVFVATFGLSASLLQLCLWEIKGSLDREIQGVVWKVVVRALLADLIVAIPLLISYNFFVKYFHHGMSTGYRMLPFIPFTVFLFLFYQLGAFLPQPDQEFYFWRVPSRSLTEECVLRVGAMGVTLMAILSGFGSICAGWDTYLAPKKLVTEADVMRAKMSLQMTQDLIAEKQHKIEQIEGRIHEKSREPSSFMNRVVNSVRGSSEQQELNALQAELKGLSQMYSSLQSSHASLQSLYTRQSMRNTPLGIISLVTRHIFALYCIYRILTSGWSNIGLLLGKRRTTANEDPISRILAILAKAWISTGNTVTLDIEGYRHLISFVLVGIVIGGSINAVMGTIRRMSKSAPLSASTYTLLISFLSGTYFVSTAVMLRSNLPDKYVGGISNALGSSLRRGIFEEWFDVVFFVVAVVTQVGLMTARTWSEDEIELEGKEV